MTARSLPANRGADRMALVLTLKPGIVWASVKRQGAVFWALIVYLVIEYVRPQQLIPGLAYLPLGNIFILLTLGLFLVSPRDRLATRSGLAGLILLYGAVVLLSTVTAYDSSVSIDKWKIFFLWVLIFFLIVSIVNTEERFFLFMMAWFLCNYYMSQGAAKQFAFRGFSNTSWGVKGAPGWFDNSGDFGVAMCLFLPLSWHIYIAVRPHVGKVTRLIMLAAPLTALLGIVGSNSRGALLGAAAGMATILLRGGGARLRAAIAGVFVIGLVYVILPEEQKDRFRTVGEDSTSTRRMTYWRNGIEMTKQHPILGVGYGNWLPYYLDHYATRGTAISGHMGRAQVSHNIFIECMAELGMMGLMVLIGLIVATFTINARTRRLARAGPEPNDHIIQMAYGLDAALVGFLASGFFVTVLYYPCFWVNLAFTAALQAVALKRKKELRRSMAMQAAAGPAGPLPVPVPTGFALPRRSRR